MDFTLFSSEFFNEMMDARDDFMPSTQEVPLYTDLRKTLRNDFYGSYVGASL